MTEAIVFDTHKFIKNLTEHGFTEEQAEVLADEQVNQLNSNLATKIDIEALRLVTKTDIEGIKADIEALRLATKADIEALRLATKVDIEGIKADIEALRRATKVDIEALRRATKVDIANLKVDLLKWMIGALIAQGAVVVALLSLIVN